MRNKVLWILFFGVLMAALDIAIVGPALPAIQTAFQVDERALSWVFNIYVLMNLVGTPLMAKLSIAMVAARSTCSRHALFAVGSAIVMLAPSLRLSSSSRRQSRAGRRRHLPRWPRR